MNEFLSILFLLAFLAAFSSVVFISILRRRNRKEDELHAGIFTEHDRLMEIIEDVEAAIERMKQEMED